MPTTTGFHSKGAAAGTCPRLAIFGFRTTLLIRKTQNYARTPLDPKVVASKIRDQRGNCALSELRGNECSAAGNVESHEQSCMVWIADQALRRRDRVSSGPASVRFQFDGSVWFYTTPAASAVYFVSLPKEMSAEILELVGTSLNPWGTVPVTATVGDFSWKSSMFPRTDRECYDLPLNARVRKRLGLEAEQKISVAIEISLTG
jgi:hypothetical protein